MSKPKKIMRSFKMNFISAVDNPAQEGARSLLLKRQSTEDNSAVLAETSEQEALKSESPGTVTITKTNEEETMNEEMQKSLDSLVARLEKAEKIAELNDVEKEHYNSLDVSKKDAFLSSDAKSREASIEKNHGEDPVVYTDASGVDYHKSDDIRLINSVKSSDKAIEKAKQLTESRHIDLLKVQAKEDLQFYPGEEVTKVALLNKVSEIADDATRDAVIGMLKANNEQLCKAFDSLGHSVDLAVAEGPEVELNKIAEEIAKRDGVSFEIAYVKALDSEEGASLYAQRGV
jgi:hypothetical protein